MYPSIILLVFNFKAIIKIKATNNNTNFLELQYAKISETSCVVCGLRSTLLAPLKKENTVIKI